ncbi:MAG: hypothetical protein SGCHY_002491 [Lobulomycetales sp.]
MGADSEIPEFDYHVINANKLASPGAAITVLYKHLTKRMAGKAIISDSSAAARIQSVLDKLKRPTVVFIDELDQLLGPTARSSGQKVIYNLFEWPSQPRSKLILIAVANTMDLPERVMLNKVRSRLGLTRVNFSPYTHAQLVCILESRLRAISPDERGCFDPDAIQIAARKVASVSGDARKALDILRRATEIFQEMRGGHPEHESAASSEEEEKDTRRKARRGTRRRSEPGATPRRRTRRATSPPSTSDPPPEMITVEIVQRALNELNTNVTMTLTTATPHEKLFLAALYQKIKLSGCTDEGVLLREVIVSHQNLAKQYKIGESRCIPTVPELHHIAARMCSHRWIVVSSDGPGGLRYRHEKQLVRLNFSQNDLVHIMHRDEIGCLRKIVGSIE